MNDKRIFKESEAILNDEEVEKKVREIIGTKAIKINVGKIGSAIEAGQTYFGQMIAHDIVPSTNLFPERKNITPKLLLNSLYGDQFGKGYFEDGKFKLQDVYNDDGSIFKKNADLLRKNGKKALIPEPRNDENIIVSQLHLVWQQFHNSIMNYLKQKGRDDIQYNKELARKFVISIFHQITLDDFLLKILHPKVYNLYIKNKEKFFFHYQYNENGNSFNSSVFKNIPLEFSMVAFRFGHSMVRQNYQLNSDQDSVFDTKELLRQKGKNLKPKYVINWNKFYWVDAKYIPRCTRSTRRKNIISELDFVDFDEILNKGKIKPQGAKLIMPIIVSDMTRLPILCKKDDKDCNNIIYVNLKASVSKRIPNTNVIIKNLLENDKLEKLLNAEKQIYADILNHKDKRKYFRKLTNDDSLLKSFIDSLRLLDATEEFHLSKEFREILSDKYLKFDMNDFEKEFHDMNLWVFILYEAYYSRKNSSWCIGLGAIGSILVAEVILQSIINAKKELKLSIKENNELNKFITNELGIDRVKNSISMPNIIKYIQLEKNYGKNKEKRNL